MVQTFQYISCYSLSFFAPFFSFYLVCVSIHLMLLFIGSKIEIASNLTTFQYISCYSLSNQSFSGTHVIILVSIHLMLLFITVYRLLHIWFPAFQYISCYSLSVSVSPVNTDFSCFNTSHVTLYPSANVSLFYISEVSIHLMLLFIDLKAPDMQKVIEFQYISCYSLSRYTILSCGTFASFNTSHVTLYQIFRCFVPEHIMFQYISCYSLSKFTH